MRRNYASDWNRRHGRALPARGGAWTVGSPVPARMASLRLWRQRGGATGTGGATDLARLEAVLFLASEPLPSRRLAQLAGLADGTQARTFVRQLNQRYDRHGFAFRVEEVAQGFQLLTRAQYGPWLRRLRQAPLEVRLSTPALETLAVVAHRQPVLRSEVEAIRGVQSGEVLKQLMEQDLVRITGRSPELGRPFLYGTTKKFLQVFGLKNLDELPRADLLKRDAQLPIPRDGKTNISDADEPRHQTETSNLTTEESDVRVELWDEPSPEEALEQVAVLSPPVPESPRAAEEDDFDDEEEEFEDDDEDEDEDDEEFEDDEELDEEDEEFEDEDWEEVDDEEEEDWDEEEEEDDDWEDEDEDDWEEEEEDEVD